MSNIAKLVYEKKAMTFTLRVWETGGCRAIFRNDGSFWRRVSPWLTPDGLKPLSPSDLDDRVHAMGRTAQQKAEQVKNRTLADELWSLE